MEDSENSTDDEISNTGASSNITSHSHISILSNTDSEENKRKLTDSQQDVPTKKFKEDLPEESETYKASRLKLTLHGNIYQLKLLMLYAKRCNDKGYIFKLATEMNDAEQFDDVVLEFHNPDDETTHGIFLQAKHVQKKSEHSRKINSKDLLTISDDGFSLQKYFRSYQKIKKCHKFKDQSKKYFIIYTNIDFKFNNENETFKTDKWLRFELSNEKELDLFKVESNDGVKKSKFYKLGSKHADDREKMITEFQTLFKETTDFQILAEVLAETLIDGSTIDLKWPLFKEYQYALVKEVIDIKENKLRKNFIDLLANISSGAKEFRDVLLKSLKETLNDMSIEERSATHKKLLITLEENNFQLFWNKMSKIELTMSDGFKKILILEENPKLNQIEKRVNEIVRLIQKTATNKIIISRTSLLFPDISKLAGHVLVKNERGSVTFSDSFLNNKSKLAGNLNIFRIKLKIQLKKKKINFHTLKDYTFQITDFVTCKENDFADLLDNDPVFPSQEVIREEIEGFMNDLIFAVNQPNEDKLGKIINEEMRTKFNLQDSQLVTNDFQVRMLDWFKETEGRYLKNDEVDGFFIDILEKIPHHSTD